MYNILIKYSNINGLLYNYWLKSVVGITREQFYNQLVPKEYYYIFCPYKINHLHAIDCTTISCH